MAGKTAHEPCRISDATNLADWLAKKARYHSIELPDGRVLAGLQNLDQLRTRLWQFPVPSNLTGKRVLDIGASDGWFSFEMERRGATVIAVDCAKNERFLVNRKLLRSNVEYVVADVHEVSPKSIGRFDIVLFLGVLHTVNAPLVALRKVWTLTSEMALVESYISGDGSRLQGDSDVIRAPILPERRELSGRFDDPLDLSAHCLLSLCSRAGFARVALESVIGQKAHVTCFRHSPNGPMRTRQ